MAIKLVAVGKKHEAWIQDGVRRYETRLTRPFDVEWILLPHSSREDHAARLNESERILQRVRPEEYMILLDERGKLYNSLELSRALSRPLEASQAIVIIIGGAYGVDEAVRTRANMIWSLSPLVFPHQLVRLILVEQLYRTQEILRGRPYHHE